MTARQQDNIEMETGWRRPHEKSLCFDMKTLLAIRTFTFNLRNADFRDYCKRRGIGVPKPSFISFYQDISDETKVSENKRMSWKLQRGQYQDCWELWMKEQRDDNEYGLSLEHGQDHDEGFEPVDLAELEAEAEEPHELDESVQLSLF